MIEIGQLEANVVLHCNNRCVHCSHASPWHRPYFMKPDVLADDLSRLHPMLFANTFYLLGGEPLLHPEIVDMIWVSRLSHISHSVGVTTNGLLFDRMQDTFWAAVQVIQLSIYPNAPANILDLPVAKAKEFGFALHHRYYTEFKRQNGHNTRKTCSIKCPTVHEGYFYMCPQSLTFPSRFMGLPENVDGFCLDGSTEDTLREFIFNTPERRTCEICGGEQSEESWSQANNEEEWRKRSGL